MRMVVAAVLDIIPVVVVCAFTPRLIRRLDAASAIKATAATARALAPLLLLRAHTLHASAQHGAPPLAPLLLLWAAVARPRALPARMRCRPSGLQIKRND